MNWKPGDRAIVVGISGLIPCVGEIVTVKSYEYEQTGAPNAVDIEPLGQWISAQVQYLRKIDDPYDGHEKTTWDKLPLECRPKELVRVEI